jgi:hypothetical protein
MAVSTGSVPTGAGSGDVAGGCTISCNEVHPVNRVYNAIITTNPAISRDRLHDLIGNETPERAI